MKNKYNFLLVFLSLMFCISFINAIGLNIPNTTNFNINKSINTNYTITFNLQNNYSATLYNITFDSNNYISMNKISSLSSGQSTSVSANVYSNSNGNFLVRIKGYFLNNVGDSHETLHNYITYDNGSSLCDVTITKGDTIVFHNLINDDIKIINSETLNEITTITKNTNYSIVFDSPQILNYHMLRRGFQFPDGLYQCHVTALDSNGYVNDPQLDAIINITINNNYNPTTVSTLFLNNNFTLEFFETDEGIFQITNTGNNTAKNIDISGDWFSFSPNNFDLDSGKSRSVSYTISPSATINETSKTNKTYDKLISINGNFPTSEQHIYVFIKYADIESGNITGSKTLDEWIKEICAANPEMCGGPNKIIYVNNQSNNTFDVQYTQEQVRQLYDFWFTFKDDSDDFITFVKDTFTTIVEQEKNHSEYQDQRLQNISERLNTLEKQKSGDYNLLIVVISIFCGIAIAFSSYKLIKYYKDKKKQREFLSH